MSSSLPRCRLSDARTIAMLHEGIGCLDLIFTPLAFSQARDKKLSSCVFVFFVGEDQLPEFFSALTDFPQLRYQLGCWDKGDAFTKGSYMSLNMESIVYVWSKDCTHFGKDHMDKNDPNRQALSLMTDSKISIVSH